MHTHLKALDARESIDTGCDARTEKKDVQMRTLGPKSQTLASKTQFVPLRRLQWCQRSLVGNWNDTRLEEPDEKDEKLRRGRLFKFPAPMNRSTSWSTVNTVNTVNTSIFVHFLVS